MSMNVSIVITAYNVEEYIIKCVDSALSNCDNNCEVIVVNDKSTDNTLQILNEHYSNNRFIKIINNENNVGPGLSRRIGIENAIGEYVLLLDGDDYIDNDFIYQLYNKAKETNADVISGGIKIIKEDGTWTAESYGNCVTESYDKISRFWGERIVFMNNKLIRRSLYNKVPYNHRRYIEDTPTIIPILWYANKVVYIDNVGYNYVMRKESLTHNTNIVKDVIYKGLCWIDLLDFFNEKDKEVFNHIGIKNFIQNIISTFNSIKNLNVKHVEPYMKDWIEFTVRIINVISVNSINFKENEQVDKKHN